MIEMDHEEYNVSLFASDKSACVGSLYFRSGSN